MIGIGCRFPGGASSPESFWDLLRNGRDGLTTVPAERWRFYEGVGSDAAAALRRAPRAGGFLTDIEGFDSEFFGLSPREAEFMDPQQRILLEATWEALENAGIPPHSLSGGDTGVFVGIGSDDYGRRMLEDLPRIEAWTGIGASMCAAANRISYALDLRGPSLVVDTACSASLVALHLACQSLGSGESPLAIAAGVNLIISPGLTLALEAAGALAPDGRCKPFDASADGYGRGEGCGVLVLKRLADARRDGDRVLAVVRGSAVNQDGRTNGIMAPSAEAQRHVIERACRQAGVAPETVDYVEAHGTGTPLGDTLEVSALGTVYGAGRDSRRPCLIGSVKSNIGHLEAAAGIAGVIKVVLALGHSEIPPSLIHSTPNPAVAWDTTGLRVVTERTPWPRRGHPRRAGVSAFGYGGTIAHVILEEAADARPQVHGGEQTRLFPLSAASATGLRQYAGRLADWLVQQGDRVPLASLGHTLAHRRSHLRHRAAIVAGDRPELLAGLRATALGEEEPTEVTGPASGLVWVFSGHGSQWTGMGRELLVTQPAFAAVVHSLEPIFLKEIGFSPHRVLTDGNLDAVDRAQAMIFAVQIGLIEVWRSLGVVPDAVIGHSVGEIAAAVACGALTLQDGARLVCRRSRLLRRVAGAGAMAMVGLPAHQVQERLAGRDDVVPAILASPSSTVISGTAVAVADLADRWQAEGISVRPVASDVAFHSPQMDALSTELAAAAADLSPRQPDLPMYSTTLSDPRATPPADGAYWAANLRNPVRLETAVLAAAQDGCRAFLEISAHPVVAHSIEETLSAHRFSGSFVGTSLRRGRPETEAMLATAAAMHCHGLRLDWTRLQPGGELVTLPPVSWQHRPHWRESRPPAGNDGAPHDPGSHTLLGAEVEVAGSPLRLWRTHLTAESRPYEGSHTIDGIEVLPAASVLATLLAAASDGGPPPTLSGVSLKVPLIVAERREVQVLREENGVRIASRSAEADSRPDNAWLTHTTAAVTDPPAAGRPRTSARNPTTTLDPRFVEQYLNSVGVRTSAFAWSIEELSRTERLLRARVLAESPSRARVRWAPLLDAAMSIAPVLFPGVAVLRMVAHIDDVQVEGEPPARVDIEITMDRDRDDTVHVRIADSSDRLVASLSGLRYTVVDRDRLLARDPTHLVGEMVWRRLPLPAGDGSRPTRPVAVYGPDDEAARALAARLTAAGADCVVVSDVTEVSGPTDVLLLPSPPPPGNSVTEAATRSAWLLTSTVQRLVAPARLWCVTTGVAESAAESHLALSPLWGVGRVAGGEQPGIWGGVIDLPPDGLESSAANLIQVMRAASGEDVIALRDGWAMVPRLIRPPAGLPPRPLQCRPDATYVVTGGLGALGLAVAAQLAERGARHIVLAGRRAPTDEALARIRTLAARGIDVRTVGLDIADGVQAARVLSPGALGPHPVRGIVHAAGVLDNRLITGVDEQSLRAVMRPKVGGAWVLHELFPPGSLDFFVLFSSCGPLLGLPGQAAYAAANAFLDALAAHRYATGHRETMTLAWTSWRGMGMSVNEVVETELSSRGVTDISAAEAFAAWDLAATLDGGYYAVLGVAGLTPGLLRLPLLDELPMNHDAGAPPEPVPDGLTGLGPEELRGEVTSIVASLIAAEMKLPVQQLDPRRPLAEQGLDSVMTVVIRRRLEKRFVHGLPADLLWHRPTVTAIADHLADLLAARHNVETVG